MLLTLVYLISMVFTDSDRVRPSLQYRCISIINIAANMFNEKLEYLIRLSNPNLRVNLPKGPESVLTDEGKVSDSQ